MNEELSPAEIFCIIRDYASPSFWEDSDGTLHWLFTDDDLMCAAEAVCDVLRTDNDEPEPQTEN